MAFAETLAQVLSPYKQVRRRMLYERIFHHLVEDGYLRPKELFEEVSLPQRTVQYHLKDLVRRGILEKHKERNGGWYYTWGAEIRYIVQKGVAVILKGKKG